MLADFSKRKDNTGKPELFNADDPTRLQAPDAEFESLDLSYEDALFDCELRSMVQLEYADLEPSPDVSQMLFRAIEHHKHDSSAKVSTGSRVRPSFLLPIAQQLASLRRALGGIAVARLIPSGVLVVLMLTALGPSVSRLLNNQAPDLSYIDTRIASRSAYFEAKIISLENDLQVATPRINSIPAGAIYDPVYDDPDTWTPSKSIQHKFNTDSYDGTYGLLRRNEVWKMNQGPQ